MLALSLQALPLTPISSTTTIIQLRAALPPAQTIGPPITLQPALPLVAHGTTINTTQSRTLVGVASNVTIYNNNSPALLYVQDLLVLSTKQ